MFLRKGRCIFGENQIIAMILKNLISLEWRFFKRSSSYNFNLFLKILLGIAAAFYALLILSLGVALYYILEDEGLEPFQTVNKFLIYWWVGDLMFRYFLQKLPVTSVRPLLIQPISKRKLTHYLLGKSAFSFYNIYPIFFFLPFSVTLIINDFSIIQVILWNVAIIGLTIFNNYLNLAINNKNTLFIIIVTLVFGSAAAQYYNVIIDITEYTVYVFDSFYSTYWTFFIPVLLAIVMYNFNYKYFYKSLYLDEAMSTHSESVNIKDYSWLERFGLMGTFLKNDLRLILRNKRSKNTIWVSIFFLFYGLFFFTSSDYDNDFWLIFAGIMVPAGFLFTFGGYVPSWDSAYYQLMMSQNIKYRDYLASKWWLMVVVTAVSVILCFPYILFGTKYYLAILVGGLYNIGVNAHLTLLSGAFVKTPIDLTTGKKPFGDKQSFNTKTILLTLPKLLLPFLIYFAFKYNFNEKTGFIAIGIFGLLGLFFRNYIFNVIEKIYKQEKYSTIKAYQEKG